MDDNLRTFLWIVALASMTNIACALLGCYLVLRRMSLLGDALSHAVLPGLVVAFLFSGSLGTAAMFAGAVAAGLLTTFLTQLLQQQARVPADAGMGVVFTSLFALGVVLVRIFASDIHIDAECVLEGLLDLAAINTVDIAGIEVPRQVLSIGPTLVANLAFVGLFWKELKITSFDPELATTLGYRASAMHYVLMSMVAVTAVASFEAVGSILVVAMLIAPAAAAHLLCDRLAVMVVLASLIAVATAIIGHGLALACDTNTAGMMAVVAGGIYGAAAVFSPRYGILGKAARQVRMSLRIIREDILAMLYRLEEIGRAGQLSSCEIVKAVGGGLSARWGLMGLLRTGSVTRGAGGLELTAAGRSLARGLVRSHRLWEAYLVEKLGLPPDHVHQPAEQMEHFIGEDLRRQLETQLEDASTDPHGRRIPAVPATSGRQPDSAASPD